jgi:hypothetical protein
MLAIAWESELRPEAILPVQFYGVWHGRRGFSPEHWLLLAVLWQAVDDLRHHRNARRPKGWRLYRDAYRWVASNDRRWPYSFLNVCDVLGLSPGRLRAALLDAGPP